MADLSNSAVRKIVLVIVAKVLILTGIIVVLVQPV
jgi:hypothetical protein